MMMRASWLPGHAAAATHGLPASALAPATATQPVQGLDKVADILKPLAPARTPPIAMQPAKAGRERSMIEKSDRAAQLLMHRRLYTGRLCRWACLHGARLQGGIRVATA